MSQKHYVPSAPAQHAATTILRNFDLLPLGDVEATPGNLAILIDVSTQSSHIVPAVAHLAKLAHWWSPEYLDEHMEQLRDAVRAVEMVRERMPSFGEGRTTPAEIQEYPTYSTSAPALYAAKVIGQHFRVEQKTTILPTERNLAILVDVCTQIFRIEVAADYAVRIALSGDVSETRRNLVALQKALRALEVARNRLPEFAPIVAVPVRRKEEIEVKLTRAQLQEAEQIAQRVAAARTADEQQSILRQVGVVR